MVKKLLKQDLVFYLRSMLPIQLILLGVALLTRMMLLFRGDSRMISLFKGMTMTALIIGIIVCLVMTVIISIMRFYKNLFTAEGYLSFTLPVTSSQHIISKLLASFIFFWVSLLTVAAALCIAFFGDSLFLFFKELGFLLQQWIAESPFQAILCMIEVVLTVSVVVCTKSLLYYTCISLGQLARKNRVLMAFGVYFIYYVISQILGVIFIMIVALVANYTNVTQWLQSLVDSSIYAPVHLFAGAFIVVELIGAAIYFLVTRTVMNRRLNLE